MVDEMESNLGMILPERKKGSETFHFDKKSLGIELLEFWQWSCSDLVSNAIRGKLAEFIVAKALEIDKNVRNEWDSYDLNYKGIKIEVKTSSYLQSWNQKSLSKIIFRINPTRAWDYNTSKFAEESKRQSDLYVFCLLNQKEKSDVDPLNLSQWDFFILITSILNEKAPEQKTISLSSLKKMKPYEVKFIDLKKVVDKIINENHMIREIP